MQLAWFLPSILMGLVMTVATGTWQGLLFSATALLAWPIMARARRRLELDLTAPIEITETHVYLGDVQLPRWQVFWRQEWHDALFRRLRTSLQSQQVQRDLEGSSNWQLPQSGGFVVGATLEGIPVELVLRDQHAHLLILGPTGTGKSKLLTQMLQSHFSPTAPFEADTRSGQSLPSEFWLFDFKGGEALRRFAATSKVSRFVTDIDGHDSASLWAGIGAELQRRESLLARGSGLESRLFLIIDELAEALRGHASAQAELSSLLSRGRSLGFHLIATSQSLHSLPRAMLANVGAHMLLGKPDPMLLMQLGLKSAAETESNISGWLSAVLHRSTQNPVGFIFPNQ